NNETRSLSKIPVLGDIPILGNLFKSSQFQKQETELMFIITADLVKPVNRDDIPQMKGVDGLKNGSPLGIEPKGDGINGKTGFSTGAADSKEAEAKPVTTSAAQPDAQTKPVASDEKTVKAAALVVPPASKATPE
ncbi:MAG TPA: hypothetical protein VF089_12565, partial [Candidatus Binatia bacterium]